MKTTDSCTVRERYRSSKRLSQLVAILVATTILTVGGVTAAQIGSADSPLAASDTENEDELLEEFEELLEAFGVEIVSATIEDDSLYVEYYPMGTDEGEIASEMGYISGAYIGLINRGLETEQMNVTALDWMDDSDLAYWYVETEWVEEYLDGDITEDELSIRILLTLEMADEA